ncbi:S1 family peptidase [Streptomyces sp. URMC 126]|uniref:S1 family peptidase n=1 Tax=Streptomyces sp. URMC 126 TaxID=3423401 RepID=UPI003F1B33D0
MTNQRSARPAAVPSAPSASSVPSVPSASSVRRAVALAAGLLAVSALTAAPAGAAAGAPAVPSAARLAALSAAIGEADVPGTAWAVDERSHEVVVTADATVPAEGVDRIRRAAGPGSDAIRVERAPGAFRPLIAGGDAVHAGTWRCSAGFNVRKGTTYYFLTAGHCTEGKPAYYVDARHRTAVGPTVGSTFPGADHGLVRYANGSLPHPSAVDLYDGGSQRITSAATPRVGQSVRRSGSTTGVRDGRVTGLNVTVNYGDGQVVRGLIKTDVCAEPGDSGGALFSGTTALGLASGGSGDCRRGGTTFYQPVVAALDAYGVRLF